MATLAIRDLDPGLKQSLRIRAAQRSRSMEEEARQILRAALQPAVAPTADLAQRVRARFAGLGDVTLPVPDREPMRPPPSWEQTASAPKKPRRAAADR